MRFSNSTSRHGESVAALFVALTVIMVGVSLATPVPLVENRGQYPDEVLFHASNGGATVFFTAREVVLDIGRGDGGGTVVRLPLGAADAELFGEGELRTRYSFFRGRDPRRWQRGAPTWSSVVQGSATAGTRITWQLEPDGLHYRIETDSDDVRTRTAPRLAGNEMNAVDLIGDGDSGIVRWRGTASATERDDTDGLLWSTFLGHSGSDKGLAVTLAEDGGPVAVGRTRSVDFPTTTGSYSTDNAGLNDVFVARLDPDGSTLIWGTLLGSSGDDAGMGVALAAGGDIVIVGLASVADWPTTVGAYDETGNGQRDAVVARLSATGDTLQWSTYIGGVSNDVANRVIIDSDGCPVIVGETASFNWPTTPSAHTRLHSGGWDVFVARLAADGSSLAASTFLGGAADDLGRDLVPVADGRVIVVGSTHSAGFPTTPGTLATDHAGAEDGFVACVDPADATLTWSTFLGGTDADAATRVVLDQFERPIITGGTRSADFPTSAGAHDQTHNGHDDVFVTKLDSAGEGVIWSTLLGGSEADRGLVLHQDPVAGVTVMGYTLSVDLPVTPTAFDTTANGSYDIFIHRFSADGGNLLAGTYLGGEGRDETYAVAAQPTGELVLIGMSHSEDFPVTPDAFDTSYGGDSDAFVARIDPRTWYPVAVEATPRPTLSAAARPNPFNPRVTIAFDLPRAGYLSVRVFDARGRLVRVLNDGAEPAGPGTVVWDGRDGEGRLQGSGTYLYEVRAAGERIRGKLALVR